VKPSTKTTSCSSRPRNRKSEEQEGQDQDGEGEQPETDEEETIIGFGEDDPGEPDEAGLVPHLRSTTQGEGNRASRTASLGSGPQAVEVGPKPTMEGCEYDEDAYDQALLDWNERDAAAESGKRKPISLPKLFRRSFARRRPVFHPEGGPEGQGLRGRRSRGRNDPET
jgi:hypothetical protein